jgi:hypothetical protein
MERAAFSLSIHRPGTRRPSRKPDINISEDKMTIPVTNLIIASQLVIDAAGDFPNFDIAWGCKIDSSPAFDLNVGMNETIKK